MKIIPQVQILADPLYYQSRRFTIELVPLLDPYGYCGTSLKIIILYGYCGTNNNFRFIRVPLVP